MAKTPIMNLGEPDIDESLYSIRATIVEMLIKIEQDFSIRPQIESYAVYPPKDKTKRLKLDVQYLANDLQKVQTRLVRVMKMDLFTNQTHIPIEDSRILSHLKNKLYETKEIIRKLDEIRMNFARNKNLITNIPGILADFGKIKTDLQNVSYKTTGIIAGYDELRRITDATTLAPKETKIFISKGRPSRKTDTATGAFYPREYKSGKFGGDIVISLDDLINPTKESFLGTVLHEYTHNIDFTYRMNLIKNSNIPDKHKRALLDNGGKLLNDDRKWISLLQYYLVPKGGVDSKVLDFYNSLKLAGRKLSERFILNPSYKKYRETITEVLAWELESYAKSGKKKSEWHISDFLDEFVENIPTSQKLFLQELTNELSHYSPDYADILDLMNKSEDQSDFGKLDYLETELPKFSNESPFDPIYKIDEPEFKRGNVDRLKNQELQELFRKRLSDRLSGQLETLNRELDPQKLNDVINRVVNDLITKGSTSGFARISTGRYQTRIKKAVDESLKSVETTFKELNTFPETVERDLLRFFGALGKKNVPGAYKTLNALQKWSKSKIWEKGETIGLTEITGLKETGLTQELINLGKQHGVKPEKAISSLEMVSAAAILEEKRRKKLAEQTAVSENTPSALPKKATKQEIQQAVEQVVVSEKDIATIPDVTPVMKAPKFSATKVKKQTGDIYKTDFYKRLKANIEQMREYNRLASETTGELPPAPPEIPPTPVTPTPKKPYTKPSSRSVDMLSDREFMDKFLQRYPQYTNNFYATPEESANEISALGDVSKPIDDKKEAAEKKKQEAAKRRLEAEKRKQEQALARETRIGNYEITMFDSIIPSIDKDSIKSLKSVDRTKVRKDLEAQAAQMRLSGLDPKEVNEAVKRIKDRLTLFFKEVDDRIGQLSNEAKERGEPLSGYGDEDEIRRSQGQNKKEEQDAARRRTQEINQAAKNVELNYKALADELGDEKAATIKRELESRGFSLADAKITREAKSGAVTVNARKRLTAQTTLSTGERVDVPTDQFEKLEMVMDRTGSITTRVNKRLLDFTGAIRENVKEVFRWSIGVGLVYGTMYKLQEVVQIAIDNQTKLADITVALGDSQRDVNAIFSDAAAVAAETGESINGVLEAYTLAYRAAGAVSDEFKRTEVANKLLSDSMVLTKLSGLSSAESIDVLSGSLRQLQTSSESSDQALMRGTELIDKWVAVTQAANVDTATLATAFSITSESAENAGVSVEELNAVIASLSEKIGGLGGKETGNAVRALIGGLYSDQAKSSLAEFGITVLDSSGKMRDFLEVTQEIYRLWESGTISDDQINKIGYALGGGVRRGQQYVAFLTDYSRIQEIVAAQSNATGSAEEALGKKLNTVQTSVTTLGNAFQTLAQALGNDGGVLDVMTAMLDISTTLVDTLTTVSKLLGDFTIPAATAGAIGLMGGGKFNSAMIGFGGGITSALGGGGLGQIAGGLAGSLVAPAMLGMALPTLKRAGSEDQGEWGVAAPMLGGAIGGLFGAGLSTLLTGSPMIGAAIGSAAGSTMLDTFINGILSYKPEFQNMFLPPKKSDVVENDGKQDDILSQQEKFAEQTLNEFGGGSPFFGKVLSGALQGFVKGSGAINDLIRPEGSYATESGMTEMTPIQLAMRLAGNLPGMKDWYQSKQSEYERLQKLTPLTEETPVETTRMFSEAEALAESNKGIYQELAAEFAGNLENDLLDNRISSKQYREAMGRVPNFGALLSGYQTALPEEQTGLTARNLARFTTVASTEELTTVNELKDALYKAAQALENGTTVTFEGIDYDTQEEILDLQESLQAQATNFINTVNAQAAIAQYPFPSVTPVEGITKEGFDVAYRIAMKRQDERAAAMISEGKLDKDVYQDMLDQENDKGGEFYDLGEQYGLYFKKGLLDANKDLLDQVLGENLDELKEFQVPTEGLGLNFFDATSEQFNQALAGYGGMVSQLEQASDNAFEEEQSWFLPVLQDGIGKPMRLDMRIVQYLLQQILDTEKKQLNGIYNLPTDASFYVPWWEGFSGGGGGGGGGFAGVNDVTSETTATTLAKIKEPLEPYKSLNAKIDRLDEASELSGFEPEERNAAKTRIDRRDDIAGAPKNQNKVEDIGTIDSIKNITESIFKIFNMLRGFNPIFPGTTPLTEGGSGGNAAKGVANGRVASTKINLNLTSNIRLVVDGAQMAMVVKKYLGEELATYSDNTSSMQMVV